ncbi:hypothetical protein VTI74DRAFT_1155 [Chaetomium olivicolor]
MLLSMNYILWILIVCLKISRVVLKKVRTILASNLRWTKAERHPSKGELHLRFNPDQGKNFALLRRDLCAQHPRPLRHQPQEVPRTLQPPTPDEIILSDATVRKITPTVRRWRSNREWRDATYPILGSRLPPGGREILCRHEEGGERCECPVPYKERRAAAFYRKHRRNNCYQFMAVNDRAIFNLELVQTLLLYGEIDPIFQVCASEKVDLKTWWSMWQCYCMNRDLSWDTLVLTALLPYINLNLLHCFPETWDAARDVNIITAFVSVLFSPSIPLSHGHAEGTLSYNNDFDTIPSRLCPCVPDLGNLLKPALS